MKAKVVMLGVAAIVFAACTQPKENKMVDKDHGEHLHQEPKLNVMEKSMDDSMEKMHRIKLTGNADYDFAAMMVPHHEGAVDMANKLIAKSNSPELIEFSNKVILDQNREISILKSFLQTAEQSAYPDAQKIKDGLIGSMEPMMKSMGSIQLSGNIDKDFISLMIPHHQSAVEMAKAYLPYGRNDEIRKLASNIISAQEKEINWLKTKL